MMKVMYRLVLPSLLLSTALSMTTHADTPSPSDDTKMLVQYLLTLGAYLGFDLTTPATPKGVSPTQQLLVESTITTPQVSLYDTLLGAIPVNATNSASLLQFVPTDSTSSSSYSTLNAFANATFKTPAYDSLSSQQGTLSVSSLIDQKTYQQDPVNQAVLNILTTPDITYCMTNLLDGWVNNCSLLYGNLVEANIIGTLPAPSEFFTSDYNIKFISQLNVNTLLSPLLYSTTSANNTGGASDTGSSSPQTTPTGLPAQSQLQQAANFIRYASGAVVPLDLATSVDYGKLYSAAISTTSDPITQKKAQATLSNYLASIRVYAAQSSVGLSNLYYILSKRMPQQVLNNQTSSQALSEFTMASWRLFNPDTKAPNKQWADQIQSASTGTVQKEMVMLLAEMNYQLYLNRQQEERMLLAESLLLLQSAHTTQPNAATLASSGQ